MDFDNWVFLSFEFGFVNFEMELDSIECVSSSDGMDEDEIQHRILHPHPHHNHHSEFSSMKPRNGNNNHVVIGSTTIAPATSVHELLECPVCTNSMYPPIHQVSYFLFHFCLVCVFVIFDSFHIRVVKRKRVFIYLLFMIIVTCLTNFITL